MDEDEDPRTPSADQDPKRACEPQALQSPPTVLTFLVYTIAGRLSILIVKGWEKAWQPKRMEFDTFSYTSSFESYRPLVNASRALQDSVLKICRDEGIDPLIIGWPLMPSDGPEDLNDLRKIQGWLLDNGLINEPEVQVVEKVITSKSMPILSLLFNWLILGICRLSSQHCNI